MISRVAGNSSMVLRVSGQLILKSDTRIISAGCVSITNLQK